MRNSISRPIRQSALILICVPLVYGQSQVAAQDVEVVRIHADPNTVLNRISPDFIGFGYEKSAVAQSKFLQRREHPDGEPLSQFEPARVDSYRG